MVKPIVDQIPQKLLQKPVVHCDETGLDVNGKLLYVHVICTPGLTYYALSEYRGIKAMEEIGFLAKYTGIVVHDFWMSYFKATGASHAMCCAHILRELTGIYENHPEQEWARKLYFELLSMCRAADFYNQHPDLDSRNHYMECLKRNYDQILEEGVDLNPIPEKKTGQRGRPRRGKIRALIDRLREYKGEVCRFADNPLVPFTNNQAERDLRMVKVKNKVIGTFRSLQGAKDFLILKSLTSTASKAGTTAFDALLSLIFGKFVLGD
jgi:transposase